MHPFLLWFLMTCGCTFVSTYRKAAKQEFCILLSIRWHCDSRWLTSVYVKIDIVVEDTPTLNTRRMYVSTTTRGRWWSKSGCRFLIPNPFSEVMNFCSGGQTRVQNRVGVRRAYSIRKHWENVLLHWAPSLPAAIMTRPSGALVSPTDWFWWADAAILPHKRNHQII